jgi:hypothetical protein
MVTFSREATRRGKVIVADQGGCKHSSALRAALAALAK